MDGDWSCIFNTLPSGRWYWVILEMAGGEGKFFPSSFPFFPCPSRTLIRLPSLKGEGVPLLYGVISLGMAQLKTTGASWQFPSRGT